MYHVLVIGAGKIGSLISFLLTQSNDYHVYLADIQKENPHADRLGQLSNFNYVQLDANDSDAISAFLKKHPLQAIISSLPFYCNIPIAKMAAAHHVHYFDLTEDVATTETVQEIAKNSKSSFVPQCGLAPGFISIVANDLMRH